MARSEVEIVSELIEAWNAGPEAIQRVKGLLAEDAQMRPLRAQLEATTYLGPEGLVRFYADLHVDWDDLTLVIEELRARPGVVVALLRLCARGRTSGVELDIPVGVVWTVEGGLVRRGESFSDQDEALRAAGFGDE